jgi:peptidoglycan/LPS O-acetylase OafA/YrhL
MSLPSERIYGLDIFRSIAILPVVMSHGGMLLDAANTGFPWIPLPDGVEIFFVLSGFLIGQILLRGCLEHGFSQGKDLMHFLKRRWFRTLPNYYLVLLLNVAFLSMGLIGGDPAQIGIRFLVFAQNLIQPLEGFFWESWSLSVEEWFYLLLPLLLFLLSKILKNLSAERKFLIALLMFTFIPVILRIIKGEMMQVNDYQWDIHFRKLVPLRLDSIATGIWFAWFSRYFETWSMKSRTVLMLAGLCIFFWFELHPAELNSFYNKVLRFSLSSWCFGACLPFFAAIKQGSGMLFRFFTFTSKISYSMYLLNLGLIAQVIIKQVKEQGNINTAEQAWMWYGIFWVLVYVCSWLLYTYWEKPMTALRERR